MSNARFFLDEDIFSTIAPALRRLGIDAVSTPECNRFGQSDDSQLDWAATESRILVTFNVADFAALHSDWIRQGRHHSGIVVSCQLPIGELLRRLLKLVSALDASALQDRIEFLGDWQ